MTDIDIIARLQRVLGGRIRAKGLGASRTGMHYKQQWSWSVSNGADFDRIAALIRPYMGIRRGNRLDEVRAASRGCIKIR